jgi:hypothetical protein
MYIYTHTYIYIYIYIHMGVERGSWGSPLCASVLDIYIYYIHVYTYTYIRYTHTHTHMHTHLRRQSTSVRFATSISGLYYFCTSKASKGSKVSAHAHSAAGQRFLQDDLH